MKKRSASILGLLVAVAMLFGAMTVFAGVVDNGGTAQTPYLYGKVHSANDYQGGQTTVLTPTEGALTVGNILTKYLGATEGGYHCKYMEVIVAEKNVRGQYVVKSVHTGLDDAHPKDAIEVPANGFALALHATSMITVNGTEGKTESNEENIKKIAVGDIVTLTNIDLAAAASATGATTYEKNASFSVKKASETKTGVPYFTSEVKTGNAYIGGDITILTPTPDGKVKVGEISAHYYGAEKDYNYFEMILVKPDDNGNYVVDSVVTGLGRPDHVKNNVEAPADGFILAVGGTATVTLNGNTAAMESMEEDLKATVKAGDIVTLQNVDPAAAQRADAAVTFLNGSVAISDKAQTALEKKTTELERVVVNDFNEDADLDAVKFGMNFLGINKSVSDKTAVSGKALALTQTGWHGSDPITQIEFKLPAENQDLTKTAFVEFYFKNPMDVPSAFAWTHMDGDKYDVMTNKMYLLPKGENEWSCDTDETYTVYNGDAGSDSYTKYTDDKGLYWIHCYNRPNYVVPANFEGYVRFELDPQKVASLTSNKTFYLTINYPSEKRNQVFYFDDLALINRTASYTKTICDYNDAASAVIPKLNLNFLGVSTALDNGALKLSHTKWHGDDPVCEMTFAVPEAASDMSSASYFQLHVENKADVPTAFMWVKMNTSNTSVFKQELLLKADGAIDWTNGLCFRAPAKGEFTDPNGGHWAIAYTDPMWVIPAKFNGTIRIPFDTEKMKTAGMNVDNFVLTMLYSADVKTDLILDDMSAVSLVATKPRLDAPTGLAGVAPTTAENNDGKITGVTADMEYRKESTAEYTAITGTEITGLEPGKYFVRMKATEENQASIDVSVLIDSFVSATATDYLRIVNDFETDEKFAQMMAKEYTFMGGGEYAAVLNETNNSTGVKMTLEANPNNPYQKTLISSELGDLTNADFVQMYIDWSGSKTIGIEAKVDSEMSTIAWYNRMKDEYDDFDTNDFWKDYIVIGGHFGAVVGQQVKEIRYYDSEADKWVLAEMDGDYAILPAGYTGYVRFTVPEYAKRAGRKGFSFTLKDLNQADDFGGDVIVDDLLVGATAEDKVDGYEMTFDEYLEVKGEGSNVSTPSTDDKEDDKKPTSSKPSLVFGGDEEEEDGNNDSNEEDNSKTGVPFGCGVLLLFAAGGLSALAAVALKRKETEE